jgi:hypothetical protein
MSTGNVIIGHTYTRMNWVSFIIHFLYESLDALKCVLISMCKGCKLQPDPCI